MPYPYVVIGPKGLVISHGRHRTAPSWDLARLLAHLEPVNAQTLGLAHEVIGLVLDHQKRLR